MDIQVNVPNGTCGEWSVEDFEVTETGSMVSHYQCPGRGVAPGKYTKLVRGTTIVMSNTPAEIRDHLDFIHRVQRVGGHILINGLGLGVALSKILEFENVESVTVIEKSEEVIKLVAGSFKDFRVEIINADAFEWVPPKGVRYNAVWHDIWDFICGDNFAEMTKLHRKYGRRTDWQESWCRWECKRDR